MILPSVIAAANNEITNKLAGTIVVTDPNESMRDRMVVMFVRDIDTNQDAKYKLIAMAKAELSNRTRLRSSTVQQAHPELFIRGDVKWGGSTILPSGLVVAFSGVQAVFDEMISEWMASAIRALCRNEMVREGGVMDSDSSFLVSEVSDFVVETDPAIIQARVDSSIRARTSQMRDGNA